MVKIRMYSKNIFFMLFLVNIGAFGKRRRIVGAITADISEFSYVASLRTYFENKIKCGGAIIGNRQILTAAHCMEDVTDNFRNWRIYTGSSSSTSTIGPMFKIEKVHVHPKYSSEKSKNNMYRFDLAVVLIHGNIEFNRFQNKIDLPTSHVRVGTSAIVTGWGQHDNKVFVASELLRKASMTILDNKLCAKTHPFAIANEQLCAFQKKGVGICTGDSGSPLVSNGKLIGIVSFGVPCGKGVSDIYIRTFSCLDFITSAMES